MASIRLGLLGSVVLCSLAIAPAHASEQSDLMACFESIQYDSDGPGDDIGRWERWGANSHNPHHRATLAVPGEYQNAKGLYLYTEDEAYFQPEATDRDSEIFGYHFDLTLPGREPFHCVLQSKAASWADVKKKIYRRGTECLLFDDANDHSRYHRARPRALPERAYPLGALRTAIQMRISSMPVRFRREVDTYAERREAYRMCEDQKGVMGLLSVLGSRPSAPLPPDPSSLIRKLQGCRNVEDEGIRGSIRAVTSLLQMTPVPAYLSTRTCGG